MPKFLHDFLYQRLWAHLPETVKDSHRLWAAPLWGGALLLLGGITAYLRYRKGVPIGVAPFIWAVLGGVMALTLLFRGPGTWLYLWVLRLCSIPGFLILNLALIISFYLVVTPLGLLLRLTGKDLLRTTRRTRPEWIRHPGPPDRKRFFRLS